jgi:hypothetical protein
MTSEEKHLLLKDLCARLPYGVKTSNGHGILELTPRTDVIYIVDNGHIPYLRPMSSMTEEEKKELRQEHVKDEKLYTECITKAANGDNSMRGKVILHFAADWCNKNHFDYRGLIPMGLALEAPEGMYNSSQKWTPLRSGLKENEDGQIVGGLKL